MKVKDIIKLLQLVNEDKEVLFSIGYRDEYRRDVAKAELAGKHVMQCMEVSGVELCVRHKEYTNMEDYELHPFINLLCENINDIKDGVRKFDKAYKNGED